MFEYKIVPVGEVGYLKERLPDGDERIEVIEGDVTLAGAMEKAIAHWVELGWNFHSFQVLGETEAILVFYRFADDATILAQLDKLLGTSKTHWMPCDD